MNTSKWYKRISIFLVVVMIISALPLSTMGIDLTADGKNDDDGSMSSTLEDLLWDFIKPFIKPSVEVEGLPEEAEAGLEIVTDPFASKSKSRSAAPSITDFLDFYDIKATDKETGEEIHPVGEVEVTIKEARIKHDQSVYIIHVLDNAEVIANADNVTEITDAAFVRAFPEAAAAAEQALGKSDVVAVEIIKDIEQNGRDLTFKTSSFSIFAIVDNPILTVNFFKGAKSDANNKIVSIRVKKADAEDLDEFVKIIYDPGIDYTDDDKILFRGWFLNNDYTVADAERKTDEDTGEYVSGAMTIVDVRNKIKEVLDAGISEGAQIDFFAMLFVQYTITYFDEGGNVCLGRDYAMQRVETAVEKIDYQVTLNYVPHGQFENFEGWKLKYGDKYATNDNIYTDAQDNLVGIYPGGDDNGPSGTLQTGTINGVDVHDYIYTTPTWTQIKGDIYLYAYSPSGHWLVFNENGKGATYIAPQFVEDLEHTVNPSDYESPIEMARYGYSFDGWYLPAAYEQVDDGNGNMVDDKTKPVKDEDGNVILGERFVFGGEMTENLTIYAKWIPAETATYTVIVWVEKSADTYQNNVTSGEREYDFYDSFSFVGATGTTVTAVTNNGSSSTSDINGNYPNARIRGTQTNGQALDRTIEMTGYHQNTEKTQTSVKIVPEGTAVINVYYDRHTVRYTFYTYRAPDGDYEVYNGTSSGSYYIKNADNTYSGPYYMTYSNGVWTYETGEYVYTPYTGTESGSYYIDGAEGKELVELTRVGDTWTYQATVTGYYLTSSTSNGYYYISDGNGGYIQKYLTRSGNVWTYGTGEYEYVESNSTSSGYYYIPDGNGGYRRVYLNRSGNAWTINGEYDYVYTPQQNADNYSGNSGSNVSNPYGSDDGINFYPIYWGGRLQRGFWKTRTGGLGIYYYSDQYHGMVYSREQVAKAYSGPIYVQSEIPATVTEAYEYGPYQVTEEYTGTVYTGGAVTAQTNGPVYTPAAGGTTWRIYYQQTGLYGEKLNWPTDMSIWWYPNSNYSGSRMTYKNDFIPMDSNMEVVYYGRTNQNGGSRIRFYTQDLTGGNNYTMQIEVSVTSGGRFNINDKFTGFQAYQYRTSSNNGSTWTNWTNVGTLNQSTGVYGDAVNVNDILEIRYRRLSNNITFLDGKYVNGNNIAQDETLKPSAFRITDEMFVDTDISAYNEGGASYYVPEAYHSEYVFAGWYADDACTHPYTFTTMQLSGVTVYAKWVQVQYRVFLHPNAGSATAVVNGVTKDTRDMTLDWGSDDQSMNFRVSYGGTISVPTGRRDEYYFVGWYTDPECTKSFIPATVLNETTVTSAYNKQTDLTDDMDKWGDLHGKGDHAEPWNSDLIGNDGGDRFWITKKLDLYAKWSRKIVGSNGMYIVYDTTDPDIENDGSATPGIGSFDGESPYTNNYLNSKYSSLTQFYCDGEMYADGAFSYGVAACDAPTGHTPELHFAYWVVQEWDASLNDGEGGFTDSDRIIYPGERFDTYYEYALQVEVPYDDPTFNKKGTDKYDENLPEHYYDYYMVIRAEYTEATPQKTIVTYDANGGTWNEANMSSKKPNNNIDGYDWDETANTYGFEINVNEEFNILVNDTTDVANSVLTRPGYRFKGWSFYNNNDQSKIAYKGDGTDGVVAADNLDRPDNNEYTDDDNNVLFAVWEEIPVYTLTINKAVDDKNLTLGTDVTFSFTVNIAYAADYPAGRTTDATEGDHTVTITASGSGNYTGTLTNIPKGSVVTVTETTAPLYTSTPTAAQVINGITANSEVSFTNTLDTVQITVKKVISSPFDETSKTFPFSLDAYITVDGEEQQVGLIATELAALTAGLGHNGTATVTVPKGARVVITETTDDAYTCDKTNGVHEIASATADETVTFTNTRKTATVTVTKTVVGLDADKNVDFTFNATSTSGSDIINGGQFTLKDGESRTITVPAGAAVTVTETANSNFYTDVNDTENTNTYTTAALAADASETVAFTNTRKITVTAKKIVDDKGVSDSWNGYMFPITLSDGTNSKHDDLAHNDTMTITVRYGATVTVSEDTEDGQNGEKIKDVYVTTYSAESVTADADGIVMTVTNTRKVFTVTVTKLAVGEFDPNEEFNFTATGLTPTSFTLKNNGTKTFTDVPYGTVITVTEDAGGNAYDTSRVVSGAPDGDSITVKANVTIAYTNTIKTYPVVVEKTVVSLDPDDLDPAKKTFTITVSYTLPNGTTGSVEMNLGNGQKNTDEAINKPIVLPYGTTYTVTETQADNFKTPVISPASGTVTGNTNISVTNERDTVDIIIDKDVTYSGDEDTTFFFDLTAPGVSRKTDTDNPVTAKHGTNSEKITVPKGSTVTITEANPLEDSTVTSTAGSVTGNATITFTATEDTTVKYINKRNPLTVKVTKELTTNSKFTVAADSTMTFPVRIKYTKDDGTESDAIYNLKADDFKEFPDVQYGSTLLVEETLTDDLAAQFKTPVISAYDTTVKADQDITVTNERATSTITVKKTVTNEAAAADFADTGFVITPEITGVTLNPASLTLKHGDEEEIIVPKGFTLKLTETVVDKFTPSYKVGSAASATSGNVVSSISTDSDEKVEFINHRDPVKVTVKKIFTGTVAGDADLAFPIVVSYVDDTNGATTKTLNLKGGASETIGNVAYGSAVTVTEEVDTTLFKDPVIESNITKITEDGTITVTNERKTATIKIDKVVNGSDADKTKEFNFTATAVLGGKAVTLDEADASFTLSNGGSRTITVPAGTVVTVTEDDYTANYYTDVNTTKDVRVYTSEALAADTTDSTPVTVTFTNTRKVKVTVIKAVSDADAALVGDDSFAIAVDGNGVSRLTTDEKSFSLTAGAEKEIWVIYGESFTVTETIASDLTWKYENPEYAADGTYVTGTGTYTATGDGTVTVTNTLKEYTVTVTKTGTSTYPANHPFKFDVEGFTGEGIVDGVTEITLGGSKTWTVKAGSRIDVTEQSDDYTASSTRTVEGSNIVDGKIFVTDNTTITFDNTIKTQQVKITKVIDNSALAEAFSSVADQNETPFGITYVVKDANGATVKTVETTIKPGAEITVDGVPYGGSVEVTEDAQTLFDVSYTNNSTEITNDNTVITITNKRKTTSLVINKTVVSSVDADKAATYNFTVAVDGMTATVPAEVTVSEGSGSITISDMPLGAKVTVTETVPQYMTVDNNDQIIEALAPEGNSLSFKNTRPEIELTLTKTVKSRVPFDYGKDYTFTYTYTVDHEYTLPATVTIPAKEAEDEVTRTITITVPNGATGFTLTEDEVDANLTVSYNNNSIAGPITADTENKEVTVTNERPEIPFTIVKDVVSDIDDYSDYDFKFEYSMTFNGDAFGPAPTVSITGEGNYTGITVPKGAAITVTELTDEIYKAFNGTDYTVAQVFTTTNDGVSNGKETMTKVITEETTVTFINTRNLVDVTVTKVVDNKWNITADDTLPFDFTFGATKLYDEDGAEFSGTTCQLANGDSIKLKVPFGDKFTATETEDVAFDTTVKIGNADAATGLTKTTDELTADGTVITFTNTRKEVKVTVKKVVNKHFDEDLLETFSFEAFAKIGNQDLLFGTAAKQEFDLKDYGKYGVVKEFNVPYGANIQVRELAKDGFTASSSTINGDPYDQSMTSAGIIDNTEVIIYNDRDFWTIYVTKTVVTDAKLAAVDNAIEFPFTYAWYKNDDFKREAEGFTLKNGQAAFTFIVPKGATVYVNELTATKLEEYNDLYINEVFTTTSQYGETSGSETVTLTANADTTIAFTNEHKTVDIDLVKVVNLDEDKDKEFTFTWSATYGNVEFGSGTVKRTHNSTATALITGVPVGATIVVTETLPENEGYNTPNVAYTSGGDSTINGNTVTIAYIKTDETITFTNTRQTYNITIIKVVEGAVANDKDYKFEFSYTDSYNGTSVEKTVYLHDAQSTTILNVPYGHEITITENTDKTSAYGTYTVGQIFDTQHTVGDAEAEDGSTVTINVTKTEEVTFTNTHKTSEITVDKIVDSKNEADKDVKFNFTATATVTTNGIPMSDESDVMISEEGTYTIDIDPFKESHNDDAVVFTIPYGFEFTVSEEADVKYITTITVDDEDADEVEISVNKDAYTIIFNNKRAAGDLKIVKTGVGDTDESFLFEIKKSGDDTFTPLYVVLHGDSSTYVMQLEAGDYIISEITEWSWRYDQDGDPVIDGEASGSDTTDDKVTIQGGETAGENEPSITFANEKNNKNWLGDEHAVDNMFKTPVAAKATKTVAWDSKFRLSQVSREA